MANRALILDPVTRFAPGDTLTVAGPELDTLGVGVAFSGPELTNSSIWLPQPDKKTLKMIKPTTFFITKSYRKNLDLT